MKHHERFTVPADQIAAQRFPGEEEERSYEAAEIAARVRAALIEARLDFCAETVFSHPSKLDLVRDAVEAGCDVVLHVVMIPLTLSIHRVRARAAAGGHAVPENKLAGRHERLWPLVAEAVPYCHRAVFWDNAGQDGPIEVASLRHRVPDAPPHWPTWAPVVLR
jgi:predicted ABC-type ATPase